jgi:hypothetical protein
MELSGKVFQRGERSGKKRTNAKEDGESERMQYWW